MKKKVRLFIVVIFLFGGLISPPIIDTNANPGNDEHSEVGPFPTCNDKYCKFGTTSCTDDGGSYSFCEVEDGICQQKACMP
jgi:hypothetical protein